MSEPIAYGIDFGTSNSSIAIAWPDRVEVLTVYPDETLPCSLPSIAYLHRNQNRAAGREAVQQFLITGSASTQCSRCKLVVPDIDGPYSDCRQYEPGGRCLDSRLITGLKSELTNDLFKFTHSWATDFKMSDLVGVILSDLKRRADDVTRSQGSKAQIRRAVIGRPIAFFGATGSRFNELQNLAEKRLIEAATLAGFDEVELYPEPAAALLGRPLSDGFVLSVDFGGGTFDAALLKVESGSATVVSMHGADVGGELFDAEIFDRKIAGPLRLTQRSTPELPHWFLQDLRTLSGFKHLLTNRSTPGIVQRLRDAGHPAGEILDAVIFGGHAYGFYKAIEQAKIRLSEMETTSIEFHPPGVDLSIPFSRGELDAILDPYLDLIDERIERVLRDGGVSPGDAVTVVRTGGSSLLSAFVSRLERRFGPDRVKASDAFTSVASGLGSVARERWS